MLYLWQLWDFKMFFLFSKNVSRTQRLLPMKLWERFLIILKILLNAGSKLKQKLPEGWPELNSEYWSHLLCFQLFWGINKLSLLNSPSLKSLNTCIDIVCTWKQEWKHLEARSLRTLFYKYFSRKRSLCFHRASQALRRLRSAHIKQEKLGLHIFWNLFPS